MRSILVLLFVVLVCVSSQIITPLQDIASGACISYSSDPWIGNWGCPARFNLTSVGNGSYTISEWWGGTTWYVSVNDGFQQTGPTDSYNVWQFVPNPSGAPLEYAILNIDGYTYLCVDELYLSICSTPSYWRLWTPLNYVLRPFNGVTYVQDAGPAGSGQYFATASWGGYLRPMGPAVVNYTFVYVPGSNPPSYYIKTPSGNYLSSDTNNWPTSPTADNEFILYQAQGGNSNQVWIFSPGADANEDAYCWLSVVNEGEGYYYLEYDQTPYTFTLVNA